MGRLEKFVKYTGKMQLITGTAVKGSDNELAIGGTDSVVVKNPITSIPYIPGSSLKGKMRSLLEQKYGKIKLQTRSKGGRQIQTGSPCGCGRKDCFICTIFGAHKNPGAESAPTRIIVRDCEMTKESRDLINNLPLEKTNYLETKAENSIDRVTGTAESPRFIERVPAGLDFNVEIVLQVFRGDNEKEMKGFVDEALSLLENSYIGGSGSRGYGQVKFEGKWSDEGEAE